jgi:hypothetical protein
MPKIFNVHLWQKVHFGPRLFLSLGCASARKPRHHFQCRYLLAKRNVLKNNKFTLIFFQLLQILIIKYKTQFLDNNIQLLLYNLDRTKIQSKRK